MARLRRSCTGNKSESRCTHYDIGLGSCILYRGKEDCELLRKQKVNHRKGASTTGKDLFRQ